jgi:hypothetical protein
MGGIRKIKTRKEEERLRKIRKKIQKNKKEKMEETKRRDFLYICRGSHTRRVFSISRERPWATTLSSRTHSYGNIPYNTTTLIKIIISRNLAKKRNIHTTYWPQIFILFFNFVM